MLNVDDSSNFHSKNHMPNRDIQSTGGWRLQYFLYSSRAYYFYLDLFENTKVLGSELHIITTKTTFIHDNKCIFFLVYSSLCLMQLFIRVRENNALTALAY